MESKSQPYQRSADAYKDAKELKLKANHNLAHSLGELILDAKELKLKANHNPCKRAYSRMVDAKELKLKANHNSAHWKIN